LKPASQIQLLAFSLVSSAVAIPGTAPLRINQLSATCNGNLPRALPQAAAAG
jgi:hypothetical protein